MQLEESWEQSFASYNDLTTYLCMKNERKFGRDRQEILALTDMGKTADFPYTYHLLVIGKEDRGNFLHVKNATSF